MMERLSSRIEAAAEREAPSHEPLIQRFDRIEQELRQLGERTDTAGLAEQVLRALDEKLKGTAQPAGLEAVERQIAALGERLDKAADLVGRPRPRRFRTKLPGIAERAARTALNDIRSTLPASADLDTLKHGFVELKALHNRSDRKTQDTLRAVHEALEALASRLPSQAAPPAAAKVRTGSAAAGRPPRSGRAPAPCGDPVPARGRRRTCRRCACRRQGEPGDPDDPAARIGERNGRRRSPLDSGSRARPSAGKLHRGRPTRHPEPCGGDGQDLGPAATGRGIDAG